MNLKRSLSSLFIKSLITLSEIFKNIIKDRGLDLNVVDLESNDNPNNYIIFSSDQKEFKEKFDKALKELYQDGTLEKLSNTYLGGSYLPDKSQLQ
ncbi:Bacterial extracellular solute-binding protein, family 3 [Streptococcus mitis]|uniref:Bacterial extracellular solute-binding protein, family 3 n=1 Tax=Streptococcus mitis TaxID=28037 RepID=A0A3R9J8S8_STRMT|nr:Bacterial extracellular solute-binding protein, family 3 [Streptococcus mitis]